MARYWRGHKSKAIKDIEERVKKASVESVAKATQSANVHSLDDWTKFVKFSLSPAEKKRRNMYVEMRKRRVLKYRGSKKGFARIAYEMKKRSENPDQITRVDVWLAGYSRKKKDGDEEVEDPEVVLIASADCAGATFAAFIGSVIIISGCNRKMGRAGIFECNLY